MSIRIRLFNPSQFGVFDSGAELSDDTRSLTFSALSCFSRFDLFPLEFQTEPGAVAADSVEPYAPLLPQVVYPSTTVMQAIQNVRDAWPLYQAVSPDAEVARRRWEETLRQLLDLPQPYLFYDWSDYEPTIWVRSRWGGSVDTLAHLADVNMTWNLYNVDYDLNAPAAEFPAYLPRGNHLVWSHAYCELRVTWACPIGLLLHCGIVGLDGAGRWVATAHSAMIAESASMEWSVALDALPTDVRRLCLVVSANGFPLSALHHLWLRVKPTTAEGVETLFGANAWGDETAAIAVEWRQEGNTWLIDAVGTPLVGGLTSWLTQVGAQGLPPPQTPATETRYPRDPPEAGVINNLPRGQRARWSRYVSSEVAYCCVSQRSPKIRGEIRVFGASGELLNVVPDDSWSGQPGLVSVARGIWRIDLERLPEEATRLQVCLYGRVSLNTLDYVWVRLFHPPKVVCGTMYGSNALTVGYQALVWELVLEQGEWWIGAPENTALAKDQTTQLLRAWTTRPGVDANWYLAMLQACQSTAVSSTMLLSEPPILHVDIEVAFNMRDIPENPHDVAIRQLLCERYHPAVSTLDHTLLTICAAVAVRSHVWDRFELVALNPSGVMELCPAAIVRVCHNVWQVHLAKLPDTVCSVQMRIDVGNDAVFRQTSRVAMYTTSSLEGRFHSSKHGKLHPVIWEIERTQGVWTVKQPIEDDRKSLFSRLLNWKSAAKTPLPEREYVANVLHNFVADSAENAAHPILPFNFGSRELAFAVLAAHHQLPPPIWPPNFRRSCFWHLADHWNAEDPQLFATCLLAACDQYTAECEEGAHYLFPPALWLLLDIRRARGLPSPTLRHPLLNGVWYTHLNGSYD